jgi:hypothetical protein
MLVHVLPDGPGYFKRKPEINLSGFQAIVRKGPPPGLIALSGGMSLGWCQLPPLDAKFTDNKVPSQATSPLSGELDFAL